MHDVLVVGGGPAGRALAAACIAHGLDTALLDPAPRRVWRQTYGAWRPELPADLPAQVVAATGRGVGIGRTQHELEWDYAVLDNAVLHHHLDPPGLTVHTGRARRQETDRVLLTDGHWLRAAVVVDASGTRRLATRRLGAGPRSRTAAEQTAAGVVVLGHAAAAPLLPTGHAVFMDWRPTHGRPGWPSFLYAVPLDGSRVLLEETSLARRPGLALGELRLRLAARLAAAGVVVPADAEREVVRFPVDDARGSAPAFGAAAPLIHPATGFSVATALRLAPRVATALAEGLAHGPARATAAARAAVWPPRALAVHQLRRRGLEVLLHLAPAEVPEFFELFFSLPERHRWCYLTGREDVAGTLAAMSALFAAAPPRLRRQLVTGSLDPRRTVEPG